MFSVIITHRTFSTSFSQAFLTLDEAKAYAVEWRDRGFFASIQMLSSMARSIHARD